MPALRICQRIETLSDEKDSAKCCPHLCREPGNAAVGFKRYGVESEIQLPSTTAPACHAEGRAPITREGGPVILFVGLIGYTVRDCLDLLAGLITSGQLEEDGMSGAKLHLCTTLTDAEMRTCGWDHEDIVCRGWVPQSELASVLSSADILFLPYSFLEGSRDAVETAFPSKTADYLCSGQTNSCFRS